MKLTSGSGAKKCHVLCRCACCFVVVCVCVSRYVCACAWKSKRPIDRSCVHVGGAGNGVAVLMVIKQCITVIILINLCWFSFYVFTELTPLH